MEGPTPSVITFQIQSPRPMEQYIHITQSGGVLVCFDKELHEELVALEMEQLEKLKSAPFAKGDKVKLTELGWKVSAPCSKSMAVAMTGVCTIDTVSWGGYLPSGQSLWIIGLEELPFVYYDGCVEKV